MESGKHEGKDYDEEKTRKKEMEVRKKDTYKGKKHKAVQEGRLKGNARKMEMEVREIRKNTRGEAEEEKIKAIRHEMKTNIDERQRNKK